MSERDDENREPERLWIRIIGGEGREEGELGGSELEESASARSSDGS